MLTKEIPSTGSSQEHTIEKIIPQLLYYIQVCYPSKGMSESFFLSLKFLTNFGAWFMLNLIVLKAKVSCYAVLKPLLFL